jgi:hypothetical protein
MSSHVVERYLFWRIKILPHPRATQVLRTVMTEFIRYCSFVTGANPSGLLFYECS